ncbi:hypothetical protein IC374_003591 [Salmonella enterica]|nr:hypothetical protein [Salmonella enterica]EGF7279324.1 hypothetical protein [Salmonella enterica]
MQLICEADEYRQVGSVNTGSVKYGEVLAYPFCPRTDEACRELLAMLSSFTIGMIMTDEWGYYKPEVPVDKHLVRKIFTQRIERNNLTLNHESNDLPVGQSASQSLLRCTRRSSEPSSRNTCSTVLVLSLL